MGAVKTPMYLLAHLGSSFAPLVDLPPVRK
jgi:hypothetical protein